MKQYFFPIMRTTCLIFCVILANLASHGVFGSPVPTDSLGCSGTSNQLPIWQNDPKFVLEVPNGKLFEVASVTPSIYVAHVYGTPYEMGYAHGLMLKTPILALFGQVDFYFQREAEKYVKQLPPWLAEVISQLGVDAALDMTYALTKDFIPQHFKDEAQGMADALGIDYLQVIRINLFPELIQAACSMMGAWGPAISGTNGTLYQLRALDWDTHGPFQDFPLLLVYHPTQPGSNAFAIWGWGGFIGALSGMSQAPVGVCEKVWIAYNGTRPRDGYPWHFLLRDILQFSGDITDAMNRIINAQRTCSIFMGLGDGINNQFRVVEYSHDYVNFFDDRNYPAYPNHPLMPGLVWVDKHVQPSNDPCMTNLLKQNYGRITPEIIIRQIVSRFQTGNMHIAIYDYAEMDIYLSICSPVSLTNEVINAYDRPFAKLSLTQLFAEPRPVNVPPAKA
jgi:hypothetical protein